MIQKLDTDERSDLSQPACGSQIGTGWSGVTRWMVVGDDDASGSSANGWAIDLPGINDGVLSTADGQEPYGEEALPVADVERGEVLSVLAGEQGKEVMVCIRSAVNVRTVLSVEQGAPPSHQRGLELNRSGHADARLIGERSHLRIGDSGEPAEHLEQVSADVDGLVLTRPGSNDQREQRIISQPRGAMAGKSFSEAHAYSLS